MNLVGPRQDILTIADVYDGGTDIELDYDNWAQTPFPMARIDEPHWGYRVRAGDSHTFQGSATVYVNGGYQPMAGGTLEWRDDAGNLLGAGPTYTGTFPVGRHLVWLYARDTNGQEGRTLVMVEVIQ